MQDTEVTLTSEISNCKPVFYRTGENCCYTKESVCPLHGRFCLDKAIKSFSQHCLSCLLQLST